MSSLTSKIGEPSTPAAGRNTVRCLSTENAADFRMKFDKQPFEFNHGLTANHPLFQLERIKMLARYLQEKGTHLHYDSGDIKISQRWDNVPEKKLSFNETLDHIENAGAWLFLRQIEKDPEYAELLDQCMDDLSETTGRDIRREQKLVEGIIFLTSPNRITSFHIDRECSILLQVSGEKQISIFDREDRDVLTEQELETFWSADNNAAVYRENLQSRANVFQLKPGKGVHIPVNCPHWLKNGDNVSISLNVNYQLKDSSRKYIYQSNYYLRKLGMNPVPPGRSPLRDFAKRLTMGTLLTSRDFVRNGFKSKAPAPTPY